MSSVVFERRSPSSAEARLSSGGEASFARFTRCVVADAVFCVVAMALVSLLYSYGKVANVFEIVPVFLNGWLAIFAIVALFRLIRLAVVKSRLVKMPMAVAILGHTKNAKELHRAVTCNSHQASAEGAASPISATVWPEPRRATDFSGRSKRRCAIVALPEECDTKTLALVEKSSRVFEEIYVAPLISGGGVTAKAFVQKKSGLRIQVGEHPGNAGTHFCKRTLDVIGAIALGLAALPAALLIAALIRLTSHGPIFYKQLRIGRGNRLFYALKFRTMFVDSSQRLNDCLEQHPALRAEWERVHKLKNDPRVTPLGRILRRFSLDELPQIWNALVGEMSLIGPRPIVISEIERYGQDYAAYEAVRPGLTGLWQVSGRNNTTYQQRVDFDAYYVRNWSLTLDAQILAKTFRAVLSGAGAY